MYWTGVSGADLLCCVLREDSHCLVPRLTLASSASTPHFLMRDWFRQWRYKILLIHTCRCVRLVIFIGVICGLECKASNHPPLHQLPEEECFDTYCGRCGQHVQQSASCHEKRAEVPAWADIRHSSCTVGRISTRLSSPRLKSSFPSKSVKRRCPFHFSISVHRLQNQTRIPS